MKLRFDFERLAVTEFGIGLSDDNGQGFVVVPVDTDVQTALCEMAQVTWDTMREYEDGPREYEPSEKHGSTEHLYLPLDHDLAVFVRNIHKSVNLAIDTAVLSDPANIFCYFARFTDTKKQRLTALRRATQFKGVLKSRNRLVRMLNDTLTIIDDTVFKLDNDFDLLVDNANVHILRPSGFEFIGHLQQAILDAVPENIKEIAKDLSFVAFDGIETYAGEHPRAARYLASIRAQKETKNIDEALLKNLCAQTGVQITVSKRKIRVREGHEMGFLEVLDRRRYELELVSGAPERFKAASRKKI